MKTDIHLSPETLSRMHEKLLDRMREDNDFEEDALRFLYLTLPNTAPYVSRKTIADYFRNMILDRVAILDGETAPKVSNTLVHKYFPGEDFRLCSQFSILVMFIKPDKEFTKRFNDRLRVLLDEKFVVREVRFPKRLWPKADFLHHMMVYSNKIFLASIECDREEPITELTDTILDHLTAKMEKFYTFPKPKFELFAVIFDNKDRVFSAYDRIRPIHFIFPSLIVLDVTKKPVFSFIESMGFSFGRSYPVKYFAGERLTTSKEHVFMFLIGEQMRQWEKDKLRDEIKRNRGEVFTPVLPKALLPKIHHILRDLKHSGKDGIFAVKSIHDEKTITPP